MKCDQFGDEILQSFSSRILTDTFPLARDEYCVKMNVQDDEKSRNVDVRRVFAC